MTPDRARRRALLTAALGFALLDTAGTGTVSRAAPELHGLWLIYDDRPL